MKCERFPLNFVPERMNEDNESILNLLQCLEEYVQAQAELQSLMGDGYMEIADARRKSTGLLVPDLVLSPGQESRKLDNFDHMSENPQIVRVSGVSEVCIRNCQRVFENVLLCVLRLAKIKGQCEERYEKVDCK